MITVGYSDLIALSFLNCNLQLFHPSALNMFNEIMYNKNGKKVVVFLDYDGTLSPIVADPDKAYMSKEV